MVPKGWSTQQLINLADRIGDGIHSTPNYNEDGDVFFVNGNNLKNGKVVITLDTKRINRDELEKHRRDLNSRTLLMSINGTIGNVAFYGDEPVVLGKSACYINVRVDVSKHFLFYVLSSPQLQLYFNNELTGTTIRNLSLKSIKDAPVALPPLPEQRKIAQILSTWDEAIATTERLLANKQQQKKALMQRLLTGKQRFAGFEGEWKTVKLKQIGKCLTGLTYSPDDVVNDGLLVLRSSNIQGGRLSFDDNVFVNRQLDADSLTREGDILICVRNGSRSLIGKTAYITKDGSGCAHGAFMSLFRSQYSRYVFQLFQTREYYKQVHQNLGATINSINTSDLYEFRFLIPSSDEELSAIVAVLETADSEIEMLLRQLDNLKQQKKALMQQLLTGKRRVKVDEAAA